MSTAARSYCPGCEPDTDPLVDAVVVQRCAAHQLSTAGVVDEVVTPEVASVSTGGGTDEAHGDNCRAIQALIR